jgi:hypothetical protein
MRNVAIVVITDFVIGLIVAGPPLQRDEAHRSQPTWRSCRNCCESRKIRVCRLDTDEPAGGKAGRPTASNQNGEYA